MVSGENWVESYKSFVEFSEDVFEGSFGAEDVEYDGVFLFGAFAEI